GEDEPAEDQRRRIELSDRDLDEHERAAPDQGKHDQHESVTAIHLGGSTAAHRPMRDATFAAGPVFQMTTAVNRRIVSSSGAYTCADLAWITSRPTGTAISAAT